MKRSLPLTNAWPALTVVGAIFAAVLAPPSCTCQRPENIEAKARLSKPAPPDPHEKAADEKIDAGAATQPEVLKRIAHMEGQEVAARLGSFRFESTGELSFGRSEALMRSAETTKVLHGKAQPDGADFSVQVTTGDGSDMRLAFVNGIFFLKNNNGKWRMSRDPQGERNAYRSDALAVWRTFYDLVNHALVVEKLGTGRHDGRTVVKYKLSLPDQGAEARKTGAALPAPPVGPDGGPAEEPPAERLTRMRDRMAKWRERAKPAGGSGELWIDEATGVGVVSRFTGKMVVGDQPSPAILDVKIDAVYSDIGKDHQVAAPKDAIEEIVRKKMPVRPREILEEEKIVAPVPRDAGPGGAASKPKPIGELPDDPGEDAP